MSRTVHFSLREFRFGFLIALFFLASAAVPATARAQVNIAAVEKVTSLNKRALDAYNNLEFEDARKLLKQALELCSASGLDKHPIKARTHIHMGVVLIASKQQELGVKQFRKALDIQPDIQVTRSLASPEIMQAFEEASSGGSGSATASPEGKNGTDSGRAPAGGGEEATAPAGIHHSPVSRGKRGAPVTIAATVDAELTGFTKVILAYRAEGAQEFSPVEMALSGRRYVGQIPAAATRGGRVAYFIEADANDDSAVATVGTEDKPFTVFLTAGRASSDEAAEAAEAANGGGEGGGDEDRAGAPTRRYFVALLGGTGIGYTTGNGEVQDYKVSAGFAPSTAAQIVPEVGYFLNPSWRLSVQLRYQFVAGATSVYNPDPRCGSDKICSPASGAFAAVARSSWFFDAGTLRPYFSLALGGGQIRHVVKFSSATKNCGPMMNAVCDDTVLAGPILAGAGGGLMLTLTPIFGVIGEVNSLLGFPNFTAHFDFNLGVAARF
jgi:hypothetical protein